MIKVKPIDYIQLPIIKAAFYIDGIKHEISDVKMCLSEDTERFDHETALDEMLDDELIND